MSFMATEVLRTQANLPNSEVAQQFDRLMREWRGAQPHGFGICELIQRPGRSGAGDSARLVACSAPLSGRLLAAHFPVQDCAQSRDGMACRQGQVCMGEVDPLMRNPAPDPEKEYAREQRNQMLTGAVRRLPIAYRQTMILALEGLDSTEISQILGITENNAGVRLNRAKQLLKKALDGKL
jgi:hypothetical protein